ncbi:hypothetical protein [Poriferisphaera sp. WC338]|uniref:hypothetical protein n=1 Tax=Poriferisphaera sp. WC338 TaxID=3425129 RepID=UPI003D81A276
MPTGYAAGAVLTLVFARAFFKLKVVPSDDRLIDSPWVVRLAWQTQIQRFATDAKKGVHHRSHGRSGIILLMTMNENSLLC